jgi:hypothetical protein
VTQPDPNQPPDPDANLTDEEKVQKDRVKRWVSDAFRETVTAMRDENPPEPPKKTTPPADGGFNVITSLFGGGKKNG